MCLVLSILINELITVCTLLAIDLISLIIICHPETPSWFINNEPIRKKYT